MQLLIISFNIYLGNYDAVTPLVDILMKLFRNMVNVKLPFHLTLLSVCFCNLKALSAAKKGPMDFYLTSSLSTRAHSGKRSFVSIPLLCHCGSKCCAHLYVVLFGDSLWCHCLDYLPVCSSYYRMATGLKYIVIYKARVSKHQNKRDKQSGASVREVSTHFLEEYKNIVNCLININISGN